jgi:predicted nuclease of predicted toxin-antitoxin system
MPTAPDSPELRLLVDACLTPAVVAHLQGRFAGRVEAIHVDAVLPPATDDRTVLDWASRQGRAVVTANIGDFAFLASTVAGHMGILLVEDAGARDAQIDAITVVVEAVLTWAAENGEIAGHIFRWRKTGGGRLAVRELPGEGR